MLVSNLVALIAILLSNLQTSSCAVRLGELDDPSATTLVEQRAFKLSAPSLPDAEVRARSQRQLSQNRGSPVSVCLKRAIKQCDCETMQESNCFRDVLFNCKHDPRQDREEFRNKVRRRYRRECRKGTDGTGDNGSSGSSNGGAANAFAPAGASSLSSDAAACLRDVKQSCNCGLWMKGSDCPEQTADDCDQSSWSDVRQAYKKFCEMP